MEGKGRGKGRHKRIDKKAMKELQCVPDIAGLSYEDMYSSTFGPSRRVQDPKVWHFRRSGQPYGSSESLLWLARGSWKRWSSIDASLQPKTVWRRSWMVHLPWNQAMAQLECIEWQRFYRSIWLQHRNYSRSILFRKDKVKMNRKV